MSSIDYNQKLNINIETEKIDIATLPQNIRNTHRFLLKFITLVPYSVDADLTMQLIYKQLNNDTEKTLTYTVSKNETRFKQKLPIGINAREWRLKLTGSELQTVEIGAMSVLWIPRRIGDR